MEPVVKWIYVVSFLDLFAVSLIIPSMSAHFKELGASHFVLGCMTSVYSLCQLISGPVIGSWSDRIGRQKILICCLLVVSCCYTSLGSVESLILIMMLRAILGLFKHIQVLINAIVSDRLPKEEQTLVSGHLKAVASVGFTVGPAIGGNLAELDNGFKYVCYAASGLFIINSAIVYVFLKDIQISSKEGESKREKKLEKRGGSIMDAIRDLAKVDWSIYGNIFALKFLMDFSACAFHNNYSLKLKEKFDVTPKIASYTISFQSLVATLAGLLVGKVSQRFYKNDDNYDKRNFHCYALMTISYLGIALTNNLSVFMMWSIMLKSVHMFLRMILTEMLIGMCPFDRRGSLLGTANSISNIARLMTPLIAGYIEDAWGSNFANILAATAAGLGILVSTGIIHKQHLKSS